MPDDTARPRGRVGGLATMAKLGPDIVAARARDGLWRKFEREVDSAQTLTPGERRRRAELAMRGYYAALSVRSASARRARRQNKTPACESSRTKRRAGEKGHPHDKLSA